MFKLFNNTYYEIDNYSSFGDLLQYRLWCACYSTKANFFLPTKPSEDPFYIAPEGFESKSPGDVLKHREMNNLFGIVVIPEKIKSVHQFLVRSEDSFGEPIAAVTTIFEPYNADPTKLLSYQAAEDAANIDCSPSYAMQLGADADTILTAQIEQLLAQAGLNEGWYVVIPDHQGPKSTFVVGESAGHIVLDSIRATLRSGNITGIHEDAKVTLWGYSGGSFASGWAAQMHPTYASELKIVGALMVELLLTSLKLQKRTLVDPLLVLSWQQ